MNFVNKRLDESVLFTTTNLLSKVNDPIVKNMTPQFKKDLFRIWMELNDITKILILNMIPNSWDDFKKMLAEDLRETPVNDILA